MTHFYIEPGGNTFQNRFDWNRNFELFGGTAFAHQICFHLRKGLMEFGAGHHVHDRIVNAVQNVRIPHVRPRLKNRVTITFQPDAAVGSEGSAADRKGTQPKRYDVEEQIASGLNFHPTHFGAFRPEPGKTSGAVGLPVRVRRLTLSISIIRFVFISRFLERDGNSSG